MFGRNDFKSEQFSFLPNHKGIKKLTEETFNSLFRSKGETKAKEEIAEDEVWDSDLFVIYS